MKKTFHAAGVLVLLSMIFSACKKNTSTETTDPTLLTQDEKALIIAAGFSESRAYKTTDGNYHVEGDILLTKNQLLDMSGSSPVNSFIVANNEHYRTTSLVITPGSGSRIITVELGTFLAPAHYSTGLNQALARYNALNLRITFQRVNSGGDIVINAANLGCDLTSAGFPSGGNPYPVIIINNNACAAPNLNTADKVDEVLAHAIGHCIGFRHTDLTSPSSSPACDIEVGAPAGAVHIPGTPTTVPAGYNSWMMACPNGNPLFSVTDVTALNYVY